MHETLSSNDIPTRVAHFTVSKTLDLATHTHREGKKERGRFFVKELINFDRLPFLHQTNRCISPLSQENEFQ